MEEKFEIIISPMRHYVKNSRRSYTRAVIRFDIVKGGIPFDNGYDGRFECTNIILKQILKKADEFLTGQIKSEERLAFEIPYIVGGYVYYGYFFDIIPDSHWVFNFTHNYSAENLQIEYSCEVSRDQIEAMRGSLMKQMDAFDWNNYGKTEFYEFVFPEKDYQWCYSAKKLEQDLRAILIGDRLRKIYVGGLNFEEPLHVEDDFVGYYLGSQVCMEFEERIVDIHACASGLFQIRTFQTKEVSKTRYFDFMKDEDAVLCDTAYPFVTSYTDKKILDVDVISTDCWPWDPTNFQESELGNPVELPESIVFTLTNGTKLSITGYDDDFGIRTKPE